MTQFQDDNVRQIRFSDGRAPPNDLDAEGVVLSSLLIQEGDIAFDRVAAIVKGEHFYSDANRLIFETVVEMHHAGTTVDLVSVASALRNKNKLDAVGGTPYLQDLAYKQPAEGAFLETHARTVREKYRRRKLIAVAQTAAAEAYGDVGEGQEWIESIESQISSLAHDFTERRAKTVAEIGIDEVNKLHRASQETGGVQGAPTGFTELDGLMSGLHDGDLTIVAARPGMGKTAFMTDLLLNIARPEEDRETRELYMSDAVLLFSLEMPREQMAMRLLCGEAKVQYNAIRRGIFMDGEYDRLIDAVATFQNIPFYIDDTPALTVFEIMAQCRKLQREIELQRAPIPATRLGAVGVDYIQLMRAEQEVRRRGSREQEVSSFSAGLKAMAKKLKIPVLANSQLNRIVEQRSQDKRPDISHLRESGSIEQDADNILLLYREAYYKKDSKNRTCEVIVGKQRNGPTGVVKLFFDEQTTRFRDLAGEEYDFDEFDDSNPLA